jgi:hypothetical protein
MRIWIVLIMILLSGCGWAVDECPRYYDAGYQQEWNCEACH